MNEDNTQEEIKKIIDVRVIIKGKVEAQLRLPLEKGYIKIITKWLTETYSK